MCFAIPGKVVEVKNDEVVVDYETEKRTAKTLFPVEVGDYVYVSGKIVIEKIPEQQALEAIKAFKEK
jgi:hydrogenase assembly chaperone HypC/HupF